MSQRKRKVQEMLTNGDGEVAEPTITQVVKVQKSRSSLNGKHLTNIWPTIGCPPYPRITVHLCVFFFFHSRK